MKRPIKNNFYSALMTFLAVLLCIPFFLLFSPLIFLYWCALPFIRVKERKSYRKSQYYRDFQTPYQKADFFQKHVDFYESMKKSDIPFRYEKKDGVEFTVCLETVYLLPAFSCLCYNEETERWEIFLDEMGKKRADFGEYLSSVSGKIRETVPDLPIRVLLDMEQFSSPCTSLPDVPKPVFVSDFSAPFEEPFPIKAADLPQNAVGLYHLIQTFPNLCGSFSLQAEKETVILGLGEFNFEFVVGEHECMISVNKTTSGKKKYLIDWDTQTIAEMIVDIFKIAKEGHLTVIQRNGGVLYAGVKDACPYLGRKRRFFEKLYFIEAKKAAFDGPPSPVAF